MKKEISIKRIISLVFSVLITVLIVIGTIAVIYYSKGYRISRDFTNLEKTGVISFESNPFRATILLEGKEVGKTPKTISSIKEGIYNISVVRDGYLPWKTVAEVIAEKSTPLYPYLFLEKPVESVIFKIDDPISQVYKSQDNNNIFIITEKEITQKIATIPEDTVIKNETSTSKLYKIWRYNVNPNIWSDQQNPTLVFEMSIPNAQEISMLISENGRNALIIVDVKSDEVLTNSTFLIDTNETNNPNPIDLLDFIKDYQITWSNNNEYLIFESEKEIISYNIFSNTKYLLMRKTENVIWFTNEQGQFYYVNLITLEEENGKSYYQIIKTSLTGSKEEILLDKIYFNTENKYLVDDSTLQDADKLFSFTNSPNSTQFVGEIKNIAVNEDNTIIIIETEFALYLYSHNENKYVLITSKPGEFISISPENEKLAYTNENGLNIFTFDKEILDHTVKLGNKLIFADNSNDDSEKPNNEAEDSNEESHILDVLFDETLNVIWHKDVDVIYFSNENKVYSINTRGENLYGLASFNNSLFAIDNSGSLVYGVKKDENGSDILVKIKVR